MENSNIDSDAEDLLRESNEHFHDLFENMMEGVAFCQIVFDDSDNPVDWIYLYVNRAFGSLTGLENILGMHATEAIPGIQESSPELLEIFGRVASTGQPESFEIDFKPLSLWLKVSASSPVKNYFVALFENITGRKSMEDELRKSEEHSMMLANLLDKSSQPFGVRFVDGKMSLYNDAFCKLVGYTKEELVDFDAIPLTPPEWVEREKVFFDELKETGQPVHYEKEYVRKDGSRVPIEVLVHLIQDDAGQPKQYYGFFTDITKRKRMEQELQLKDFAFKSSITPEAIANMEGFITHVNESFVRTWGYDSADELIGMRMSMCHADLNESDIIIETVETTGSWSGEYVAKKKDGSTFTAMAQKSLVLDKDGNQIALYTAAMDITDRKRVEVNLKKTLLDLSRSNRDLEQFAYVASHDLQEPLRMVSSYVKLLERRYKDNLDADANDFINFAVDGAVRMQNLINDLLLFSRVHTRGKEFEFTNLEDVLAMATNNLRMQIEENDAIITHDPLPTIMVDRGQITQVLQNLVSNGVKFHREEDVPRVHVSAKENDDEWILSVQDNGIGIEPQYFDRLFIIFQRLNEKGKYPGTGIGLAICKRIIERHDGRVWLESEPGMGSTFYFSISKNLKNNDSTIEGDILDGT